MEVEYELFLIGFRLMFHAVKGWVIGMRSQVCFVAVVIFLLGLIRISASEQIPTAETLKALIREGVKTNRNKLQLGHLVWKVLNKEDWVSEKRKLDHQSDYEMWWDGPKITTLVLRDSIYIAPDGTHTVAPKKVGHRMAHDGKNTRLLDTKPHPGAIDIMALLKKPRFEPGENWFHECGLEADYHLVLRYFALAPPLAYKFAVVERQGTKLLKFIFPHREYPKQRAEILIDPAKGYLIVEDASFDDQGRKQYEGECRLQQVAGGGWVVVETTGKYYDPPSGKIQSHTHRIVDLDKSSFNDPKDIPEGIFEIPITNGMDVTDNRADVPFFYHQREAPLDQRKLAEVTEGFLGATEDPSSGPPRWVYGLGSLLGLVLIAISAYAWWSSRRRG